MKKKSKIFLFAALLAVLSIAIVVNSQTIRLSENSSVSLIYKYDGKDINMELDSYEAETVIRILNNKRMSNSIFTGIMSCGFSEDVAFIIDNKHYELASDGCGSMYVEEMNSYIDLTVSERGELERIFSSKGGFFPCV